MREFERGPGDDLADRALAVEWVTHRSHEQIRRADEACAGAIQVGAEDARILLGRRA